MDYSILVVAAIFGLLGGMLGSFVQSKSAASDEDDGPVHIKDGLWFPEAKFPPPPAPPRPPAPPNMKVRSGDLW